MQVLDGEDHERRIDLRQPCSKRSDDPEDIVAHRTVGPRRDHDSLVSDFNRQLTCHLYAEDQLVTPRRGETAVAQLVEEPAQTRFEVGIDAHQHSCRRRIAGTDETACVDPGGGRHYGRIARDGPEKCRDIRALAAADRFVQATLGTVVACVNLNLPADKPGRVLDHFGRDPVGPAHDEDDGEIASTKPQRSEDRPFPVTPKVAPANPDPGTRRHR